MQEKLLRDSWEFQEELQDAGRKYDALRGGEPRGLFTRQRIASGIWEAQWTNRVPVQSGWDVKGMGGDMKAALEMLLRCLRKLIAEYEAEGRESGKIRR